MYLVRFIKEKQPDRDNSAEDKFYTGDKYYGESNEAMNAAIRWIEKNNKVISTIAAYLYSAAIYEDGICVLVIDHNGHIPYNTLA